jgi:hypothetical protein
MKHIVRDVSTPDFIMKNTVRDVSTPGLARNTLYATCQRLVYHETHCMRRVDTWFSTKHTVRDVSTPGLARNTLYATCQRLVYQETHCMRRVNAWILEHFRRTRPERYTVTTNDQ